MAERAGFEPAVGVTLRRFSKPLPSATRPPLRSSIWLIMLCFLYGVFQLVM